MLQAFITTPLPPPPRMLHSPQRAVCPIASASTPGETPRHTLRNLRHRLSAAIAAQRFTEAAALRDELAAAETAVLADDDDAVLAANDAFYAAFRAADPDLMRDVWLNIDAVSCAHPMAGLVVGYEEVVASWAGMFAAGRPTEVDVEDISVNVKRNVAWVVCSQMVKSVRGRDTIGGLRVATNVFQKRRGRWKLVHHHASPVVVESEQAEEEEEGT